ncbi:zinc finger protein Xfin-like isoform X1 [Neocloeon triangulifer]|uniref:zinc finger protein Xfin-like isoform X1 n=1 Tax=Neocloeon triangulifer TaxID=2078957 RepID=UPI00286EB742|nr:zinc finger protein Xfin-like isoform X1 [Neocloeon triangulifer]
MRGARKSRRAEQGAKNPDSLSAASSAVKIEVSHGNLHGENAFKGMRKSFRLRKIKLENKEEVEENELPFQVLNIKQEPMDTDEQRPTPGTSKLNLPVRERQRKQELEDLKPFSGQPRVLHIRPTPLQQLGKKFTCDICQKGVGTKGGLKYHIQAHLFGRPFKCDICKRSYATKNDFDTHNKRHLGTNLYCNFCHKSFPVKSYLADHIACNHLPREYTCNLCRRPWKFLRKNELETHLLFHTNSKLTCKLCKMVFKRQITYSKHCKEREKMKHECKECKKKFPCRNLLLAHVREKKIIPMNTECPDCKIKVKNLTRHNLNYHKIDKCDICSFSGGKYYMYTHKLKCGTEEQIRALGFQCKVCNSFFRTNHILNMHISRAHGTIKCPKCPRKFISKKALISHNNQCHTNAREMPFACLACPNTKLFSNRDFFNAHFFHTHQYPHHIKRRDGIVLFACGSCRRCFRKIRKSDFVQHIKLCYKLM